MAWTVLGVAAGEGRSEDTGRADSNSTHRWHAASGGTVHPHHESGVASQPCDLDLNRALMQTAHCMAISLTFQRPLDDLSKDDLLQSQTMAVY